MPDSFLYIIAAPRYTHLSAGVRVLHQLCHDLNESGQRAYIALYPKFLFDSPDESTALQLNTPIITHKLLQQLIAQGNTPIVIYPEVTRGNPFNAPLVLHYVMNYMGLLSGDEAFAPQDMVYAYSKRLATHMALGEERVLFMPISDDGFFTPPPPGSTRSGSCFYAAKYQHHFGGKLLPVTKNSIEITRDLPDSPSREEIRELLQECEVFYAYEDTALIIEAGLCGCPAVLIPNDFFKESLGLEDIGMNGVSWGTAPESVEKAKATVTKMRANYELLKLRYQHQLMEFITQTQAWAKARGPVENTIILPGSNASAWETLSFAIGYIKRKGLGHFLFKLKHFMRKRGMKSVVGNTIKNFAGGAADRQP